MGPAGTKIATNKLPVGEVNKVTAVGRINVGWLVCLLSMYAPPVAWASKGLDRNKLHRRCGEEGHIAREYNSAPKCLICTANKGHMTGGPKCSGKRGGRTNRR